ncbi:hypothetical protein [Streptomyces sp. NPDC002187]|uniref:hypothetical protein n=1 Tax=Streptomyces sp. NPDC002187 TaxID=3364637 RepID=UPI0036B3FFE1
MGIESDQLVYDYLSRVGDLAQQAQLPSGARMRLVTTLRSEIDRQRSTSGDDSPASVRKILGRLGTPDEVVASASAHAAAPSSADDRSGTPRTASGQRAPSGAPSALPRQRGWRGVPRPRTADTPAPRPAASPPHLAGMDELGPSGSEPDWWRIEPGPFGPGESVAGFVGGVEIPEILKPPPSQDDTESEEPDPDAEAGQAAAPRPWWRSRLRRRRAAAPVPPPEAAPAAARPANAMLLLAAALLLVGAVLGSLLALGGGWLLAYGSRRLSRAQVKWVVVGLPSTVAAAGAVWLWGRVNDRWGEPIAEDGMREALTGTWPWVLRGAAVASALYLVWRARRR